MERKRAIAALAVDGAFIIAESSRQPVGLSLLVYLSAITDAGLWYRLLASLPA